MLISSRGGKNFIQSWTALFQKQQWTNRDQHPEKWVRTVFQGPLSWCPVCPVMVRGFYISEGRQLSELQLFQSWKLFQGRANSSVKEPMVCFQKGKREPSPYWAPPWLSVVSCDTDELGKRDWEEKGSAVWVCQSAGKSSFESRLLWAGQVELRWNYPEKWGKMSGKKIENY